MYRTQVQLFKIVQQELQPWHDQLLYVLICSILLWINTRVTLELGTWM